LPLHVWGMFWVRLVHVTESIATRAKESVSIRENLSDMGRCFARHVRGQTWLGIKITKFTITLITLMDYLFQTNRCYIYLARRDVTMLFSDSVLFTWGIHCHLNKRINTGTASCQHRIRRTVAATSLDVGKTMWVEAPTLCAEKLEYNARLLNGRGGRAGWVVISSATSLRNHASLPFSGCFHDQHMHSRNLENR
jgi:hypothetical protein